MKMNKSRPVDFEVGVLVGVYQLVTKFHTGGLAIGIVNIIHPLTGEVSKVHEATFDHKSSNTPGPVKTAVKWKNILEKEVVISSSNPVIPGVLRKPIGTGIFSTPMTYVRLDNSLERDLKSMSFLDPKTQREIARADRANQS